MGASEEYPLGYPLAKWVRTGHAHDVERKRTEMAVNERTIGQLAEVVGEERVRADRRERKMYSFDIGSMPKLVKPFVPAGLAGAVVRPHTEDEVVALVKLARCEKIKIVPRGWATSGYGGVLPPKDAVVIDMSAMMRVLDVDVANKVVTTQPSAIWEMIDRQINKQGLDAADVPLVLSQLERGGMAGPGRIGLRQLRVRPVQGQRRLGACGPSHR